MTRRVFVNGLSRSRLEAVFAFSPENVHETGDSPASHEVHRGGTSGGTDTRQA